MAHANFHLAAGMAVGTALTALPVLRAYLADRPLARPLARLWIVTAALGLWATVPDVASALGVADVHLARWADVFVLHRAIDGRVKGGLLLGELGLVAQLAVHYLVLLVALRRARRRARPPRRDPLDVLPPE